MMMSIEKRPELLAPAGDWDSLRAAVANGADAVYFGLSQFNARHRAANFTADELPQVMAYLHEHNVKGYLAFNTLIFSDELPKAVEFAKVIAESGVDAVIVQDLGLARLLHQISPSLKLHGSTQMTLAESRAIDFVRQLGIERVILPRELSANDIRKLTESTSMPLEVFVHGALCVAYSGQCLTSESLGGRSANRGQCAQACRLPYELIVDNEPQDLGDRSYLLSPQDLAAYDRISDLLKLGVSAFKIEGRLKSAHYVAATTQTYRAAIDVATSGQKFKISPQQHADLVQSFSRGFSHGFLDGINHQQLVPARFPKSRGLYVGKVTEKTMRGIVIEFDSRNTTLKPGDGVVFDEGHPEQDEQGGRVFEVHFNAPNRAEIVFGRGDVNHAAVSLGSMVWKTDDPAVRKRLQQSFNRDQVVRRVRLSMIVHAVIGSPLRIEVRDDAGHLAIVKSDQPLQEAQKHPLSLELVQEQFGRLGQTPFELGKVQLVGHGLKDPAQPVMVPKSILNDLRRQAVEQLTKARQTTMRCPIKEPAALETIRAEVSQIKANTNETDAARLTVLTRTIEQLRAVLEWTPTDSLPRPAMVYCDFEDVRRYKEAISLARGAKLPIALATLRIIKPGEDGTLQQIADSNPDAVLIRNIAAMRFFQEKSPTLKLLGDYSLNIANEITAALFIENGITQMVPSYDLNWTQLSAMLTKISPALFEIVLHQHMPMFHMEHCIFAATLSTGKDYRDCGRPCEQHRVDLRDRSGTSHPLIPDTGCRNTLYNATPQSAAYFLPQMKKMGIPLYRVELLRESPDESKTLLTHYARTLAGLDQPPTQQLHVLNHLGTTPGTLGFD